MRTGDYKALSWDTKFFNFPVGRINAVELNPEEIQFKLANIVQCPPCRLLYILINSEDELTQNYVKKLGAQLVDKRVVFRRSIDTKLSGNTFRLSSRAETFVESESNELNELAFLAGKFSRYRTDQQISESDFQRLYALWIKRSISGAIADKVLITRDKHRSPASLITLNCNKSIGTIGLIAVRSDQHGNGLGFLLVNQALQYFTHKLCTVAQVATQETNVAACKLYRKCGFIPFQSNYTYHLWLPFSPNRNKR